MSNDIKIRNIPRILLGIFLVAAGVGHLTYARKPFQAQVPDWVPGDVDDVVLASGVVEIALGTSLIVAGKKEKEIGIIAALFFAAVFPGNIAQYKHKRSDFGLDTNGKLLARLFFQPVLIYWALKSTGSLKCKEKCIKD